MFRVFRHGEGDLRDHLARDDAVLGKRRHRRQIQRDPTGAHQFDSPPGGGLLLREDRFLGPRETGVGGVDPVAEQMQVDALVGAVELDRRDDLDAQRPPGLEHLGDAPRRVVVRQRGGSDSRPPAEERQSGRGKLPVVAEGGMEMQVQPTHIVASNTLDRYF